MFQIEPEWVAVALAWLIRELFPIARRRMQAQQQQPAPSQPGSADGSGAFTAVLPEGLATQREVDQLKKAVARLEKQVVALDKLLAVLRAQLGIAE